MGLLLLQSDLSPDLKSAVTLPCFQMAGKTLESRERLNNLVNTGVIHSPGRIFEKP